MIQTTLVIDGVTRVITKRSFVIGAGEDVDVPGSARARVVVRRRDLVAIVRPIDGPTTVNQIPITGPVAVRAFDDLAVGITTMRLTVTGDPISPRWWDPRDWGDDGEVPFASDRPPIGNSLRHRVGHGASALHPRIASSHAIARQKFSVYGPGGFVPRTASASSARPLASSQSA
jgi:hypothetical protein